MGWARITGSFGTPEESEVPALEAVETMNREQLAHFANTLRIGKARSRAKRAELLGYDEPIIS